MAGSIEFPVLSKKQIQVIKSAGRIINANNGDILITEGAKDFNFYVVVNGSIDILDPANDFELVTTHTQNEFTGDVDMLSSRAAIIRAVAAEDSELIELSGPDLQNLIADHIDISDTIISAFIARRQALMQEPGGFKLIGSRYSKETYAIRNFLSKNHIRFTWLDTEIDEGARGFLENLNLSIEETPLVINNSGEVYRNPTLPELAQCLGLSSDYGSQVYDVLIVGAGPAGLAASVYGASEGLKVITIDSVGPGGQAGKSSKIENYLGFPAGLSGGELAQRSYIQAQKFGCTIVVPTIAKSLDHNGSHFILSTSEEEEIHASTVLIATGVDYRGLNLPNFERFGGQGIYYSATNMQAESCREEIIAIVGGGNSAGQAALFLGDYGSHVHMILRSNNLGKSMSDYLVRRIKAHPKITVHYKTQVTKLSGDEHLEKITLTGEDGQFELQSSNLFIFIGAKPSTDWITQYVAMDEKGFIVTGRDIRATSLDGYQPRSLETSVPGLFAVGDVRSGSTKRVASAVGEGSMAISMVHQFLATK